jgi:hypothetical protein
MSRMFMTTLRLLLDQFASAANRSRSDLGALLAAARFPPFGFRVPLPLLGLDGIARCRDLSRLRCRHARESSPAAAAGDVAIERIAGLPARRTAPGVHAPDARRWR